MKSLKEICEALVKGNVNKINEQRKFQLYWDYETRKKDDEDKWWRLIVKIDNDEDITRIVEINNMIDESRFHEILKYSKQYPPVNIFISPSKEKSDRLEICQVPTDWEGIKPIKDGYVYISQFNNTNWKKLQDKYQNENT